MASIIISTPRSLSQQQSERISTPPSQNYQASVYSSRSRSRPYSSKGVPYRDIHNSSLEYLLRPVDKTGKLVRLKRNYPNIKRSYKQRRMASHEGEAINIERKKSYGIGGAGNIRRPSDVVYPPRMNPDGTRRASVWSNMSTSPPDGRRASIMSFFRKGSVGGVEDEAPDSSESGKGTVEHGRDGEIVRNP